MLNGKTICVPVYSNSPTLQLSQLLSNPYSWKVSCFVFKSEVIYISTPETKYRIPEKQVLIKKLIPIKQSECSTIEEEMNCQDRNTQSFLHSSNLSKTS